MSGHGGRGRSWKGKSKLLPQCERFVNIEGNICDAGANPIVVKVHLEDTGSSNTTRAVHDDIVFEDKLRL